MGLDIIPHDPHCWAQEGGAVESAAKALPRGPWPGLGVVPDGDHTVFPAARTGEPPWRRGGMSHLPWSLQPCAEGWTLGHPLPRSRTELSISWRPLTHCRSTHGWLISRAAWTPGECPGGPRMGGWGGGPAR